MPPTAKLPLLRVLLIGLVLPILLAFVDNRLLARELFAGRQLASAQAMAVFVFQVGLFGVLCGRLVEPAWLRWVLFAWCLLFTDLTAASSLSPEIAQSLFTAQIGLVTVWVVLGTTSWKIRLPVALLLILPMLALIAQSAALCLICLVLRSQRYRLARLDMEGTDSEPTASEKVESKTVQFGIRDILLWTTALAPLLAVSRLGAWQYLTDGVLQAIVLVFALWAALGEGPRWLRWPLLIVFAVLAGMMHADFDMYVIGRWRWVLGGPARWWSIDHLHYYLLRWDAITAFCLAGGMLAATLLIYRVLGYRLCRSRSRLPDGTLAGMDVQSPNEGPARQAGPATAEAAELAWSLSQAFDRKNISDFFSKSAIFHARFSVRFSIGYREGRFSH